MKHLVCRNCGNLDIHISRRARHPFGMMAFYDCENCGARCWDKDLEKYSIGWVEIEDED